MAVICGLWAPGRGEESQAQILGEMTRELERTTLNGVAFQLDDDIRLHGFEHPRLLSDPVPSDFCSKSDDGSRVFGEMRLYNRPALVDRSSSKFNTGSDISVVARFLNEQGATAIRDVEGDFCLARYVPNSGELTLLRDIIGHKSWFYAFTEFGLAFSSIVQPIDAVPGFEPQLSVEALAACLVFNHPGRGTTCFDNISEVGAGSICTLSTQRLKSCDRYWHPAPDLASTGLDDTRKIQGLTDRLVKAVVCRLPKNKRSAGIQLSGGLDSSTVAGIAASVAGDEKLFAISHVLPEGRTSAVGDETAYIESVLEKWPAIEWAPVSDDGGGLLQGGDDWHKWFCCPNPDGFHNINQRIFKEAEDLGLTVLLNGLGGDECISAWGTPALADFVFSGRARLALQEFRRLRVRHPNAGIVRLLKSRLLAPTLPNSLRSFYHRLKGKHWSDDYPLSRETAECQRIMERLGYNHFRPSSSPPTNMLKSEMNNLTLFDHYHLPAMDFLANLAGFQLRYPLLDRRLMEFVMGLPASLQVSRDHDRMLLRLAGEQFLPAMIRERRDKLPFYPDYPAHVANNNTALVEAIDYASSHPVWKELVGNEGLPAPEGQYGHFTKAYAPSVKLMQLHSLAAFLVSQSDKPANITIRT